MASRARYGDEVHRRQDYQEGVVFSAVHHIQDFEDEGPSGNNRSMTRRWAVYSKHREYVVIGKFETHVIGL